jgi:putative hydrolase of the HAD superfamily
MTTPRSTAAVFDAVGTLIYPDPPIATAYAACGRRFGSTRTVSEIQQRFHAVYQEIEARDRGGELRTSEEVEHARWREIVARVLDDVLDHAACFASLFDHFARPSSWRVYDDASAVIRALAARGTSMAIASNFDRRLITIARELEPLDECAHVLVSSEVGYRKPHLGFFEAVVATLGVATHEVLYIGDDPLNDLVGAAAAGLRTFFVRRDAAAPPNGLAAVTELVSYHLPR